AKVDEADIGNVQKGQRASFTVDAYIEDSFQGKVADVRLHPSVSANVVTYTTIINAPNDDMKLKPGMTANINVYTKEVNHALLVSSKALNFSPDSTLDKLYHLRPWSKNAAKTSGFAGSTVKRNDSTNKVTAKPAYVWLKKGDFLVQTPVKVGLDDNTHAEILQGLTVNDLVVSSMPVPSATAPAASASIIPRPPGNNRKK
ncbi:MAG: efflux RND transporter periplasmic adaptor subunit, partial [Hymenobacter sp.]